MGFIGGKIGLWLLKRISPHGEGMGEGSSSTRDQHSKIDCFLVRGFGKRWSAGPSSISAAVTAARRSRWRNTEQRG